LRFAQAIEEPEKLLDVGDFQGGANALAYSYQRYAIFVSLVPDIGPDKRTDSRRIHVGHVG
jgi:hypothetical protein